METLIQIAIFVILVALGYFFGRRAEQNHYKSINEREENLKFLPTTSQKKSLHVDREIKRVLLVNGSVVISIDYFKRILAGLRNIFGGNVQAYETLVDRARREAILRLKESCKDADEVINLRLETSSISKNTKQVGSVEVLAYGTAIYYAKQL